MDAILQFLPDKTAYCLNQSDSAAPYGLTYIHGFRSDMDGEKAIALQDLAHELNMPYLRYDIFAHGKSSGAWNDFSLAVAVKQAKHVLSTLCDRPQIVVGSSMGGWIGLRLAQDNHPKVAGLVGVAAAPDFTQGIKKRLTTEQAQTLALDGYFDVPSPYSNEFHRFTKTLLDDPAKELFFERPFATHIPVHLVQGRLDASVAPDTPERIRSHAQTPENIDVTLIADGEHRLSRPCDLAVIGGAIRSIAQRLASPA